VNLGGASFTFPLAHELGNSQNRHTSQGCQDADYHQQLD
jgi:hypothetical protein